MTKKAQHPNTARSVISGSAPGKQRIFVSQMPKSRNPVLIYVLYLRACGWKHSQVPWTSCRWMYNYCEQEVDVKGDDDDAS